MRRFPVPRGRRRIPGAMNATEAAYSKYLELLVKTGDISGFWFERVTLRLAPDTRLTIDFMVIMPDGEIQFHDTKGRTTKKRADGTRKAVAFVREDAHIKLKVAAEMFPFRVFVVFPEKGGAWNVSEV